MPYAYLIVILVIFGSGFGAAHQLDRAEILSMENRIADQKAEASAILATKTAEINAANLTAFQAKQQLDKAHDQSIQTINTLHTQLGDHRLRIPAGGPRSNCSAATSSNTGQPETDTADGELPAEFSRFLKDRFYQADIAAEYAAECRRFVVEQNCGIAVK